MAYQTKKMKRNEIIGSIWAIAIFVMGWLSMETSWYIGWPIIIAFFVGMFYTVRSVFGKIFYLFFSCVFIAFLLLGSMTNSDSNNLADIKENTQ